MCLVRSFPTAYHTPSFNKRFKNWSENSTKNLNFFEKTEFRDLVNLKLLLNRKELEKDLYMKKMRLNDIYPTAYHLLHSDKRFRKKPKKCSMPLVVRRAVFETALKPQGISKSVQHNKVVPNP